MSSGFVLIIFILPTYIIKVKITVVIVSYNVKFYLQQCLDSLLRALQGIESEVFVVDNHSKDGSVDYLSKRFPGVNVIDSPHNLGFARANNLAIRKSHAEYVLLLNPDTVVGESTIRTAIDFMDAHEDAGSLGVRMLDASGKAAQESRRGLPSPMVAFYKMVGLCARFPKSHRFGHYYMSALPWDEPGRIEVVSGAFCLLRKKAIDEVGYLDEDFFMYGEDIDLSYRILKGGFHNYYLPSTICIIRGRVPRSRASAMCMCSMRRCLSSSENIIPVCRGSSVYLSRQPFMPRLLLPFSRCRLTGPVRA